MSASATSDRSEISDIVRYTGYSVFRRANPVEPDTGVPAGDLGEFVRTAAERDVVVRGFYDVSGMRADADLMVWWHAPAAEDLQAAARAFRATAVGRTLAPVWSAIGLHRQAEFNKAHVPAFLSGKDPGAWVTVYPFVRSHEWYLLPQTERRALLAEHGSLGRDFPDVLTNTVAGFALGDYEWLLAIESDRLDRIVDMMRHLRVSATRRHVRAETPFFTGRRLDPSAVPEVVA